MFGSNLYSWRQYRNLSQAVLAEKTGLTRPYLSRLEQDRADPSLSVLLNLASALDVTIGDLIEKMAPAKQLDRFQLDALARQVWHPGTKEALKTPHVRQLARLFRDKREAVGAYKPRKKSLVALESGSSGRFSLRRLKMQLGPEQWNALLRKIEKHSFLEVSK